MVISHLISAKSCLIFLVYSNILVYFVNVGVPTRKQHCMYSMFHCVTSSTQSLFTLQLVIFFLSPLSPFHLLVIPPFGLLAVSSHSVLVLSSLFPSPIAPFTHTLPYLTERPPPTPHLLTCSLSSCSITCPPNLLAFLCSFNGRIGDQVKQQCGRYGAQ